MSDRSVAKGKETVSGGKGEGRRRAERVESEGCQLVPLAQRAGCRRQPPRRNLGPSAAARQPDPSLKMGHLGTKKIGAVLCASSGTFMVASSFLFQQAVRVGKQDTVLRMRAHPSMVLHDDVKKEREYFSGEGIVFAQGGKHLLFKLSWP